MIFQRRQKAFLWSKGLIDDKFCDILLWGRLDLKFHVICLSADSSLATKERYMYSSIVDNHKKS